MSNPTGWTTPKTNWVPADGIANTDLNRIETNISGLRNWDEEGNFLVDTVHLPGGNKQGTIYWMKYHNFVMLRIPELLGTSNVGASFSHLNLTPTTTWPTQILVDDNEIFQPFVVMSGATSTPGSPYTNGYIADGFIELPYTTTASIYVKCSINSNMFTPNAGIMAQFVSYFVNDVAYSPPTTTTTTVAP